MEGRDGHICLGLVFFVIGLWHLYNQIKTHTTNNKPYISQTWFPISFSRYLELYVTMISCSIFILIEVGHPLVDNDGAILSTQLNRIEHASIAMPFFLHALFAILLDKTRPKPISYSDLTHFIASVAFAQELLLFHFHSTDHVGLEGHYHWLLQQVILICLVTTILAIWLPKCFMVSYIRSLGVIFQGLWLIVMGFMLWTPARAPKGCSLQKDDYGRDIIKCDDEKSMHRAKALVNVLFSWFLICIMAFGLGLYMFLHKVYSVSETMVEDGDERDCELEDRQGFLNKGKMFGSIHSEV